MKIAADFSQREIVHSAELPWTKSPMVGVDRRPLDRVGGEVARATTIVRYAPGSHFSSHVHTGGEEFIVIDGIFQDEHGDFPVGSYIRNPPQSNHTPRSDDGCIIMVKLWQFQLEDRTHVRLQMDKMGKVALPNQSGVYVTPLYKDQFEEVSLYSLDAGAELDLAPLGGAEIFMLEGELKEKQDVLVKHSWGRFPIDYKLKLISGSNGVKFWMKTGHLVDVDNQISRVEEASIKA